AQESGRPKFRGGRRVLVGENWRHGLGTAQSVRDGACPLDELAVGKDDHPREGHAANSHEPEIAIDEPVSAWPVAPYPAFVWGEAADHGDSESCQEKPPLPAAMADAPRDDSVVTLPLRPKQQQPKGVLQQELQVVVVEGDEPCAVIGGKARRSVQRQRTP